MLGPVLAAANKLVLSATANWTALYLLLFFHAMINRLPVFEVITERTSCICFTSADYFLMLTNWLGAYSRLCNLSSIASDFWLLLVCHYFIGFLLKSYIIENNLKSYQAAAAPSLLHLSALEFLTGSVFNPLRYSQTRPMLTANTVPITVSYSALLCKHAA